MRRSGATLWVKCFVTHGSTLAALQAAAPGRNSKVPGEMQHG
jgi:hypothetical protein